jgi:PHP family Zn ribbon phosphoesterase
MRIKKDLCYTGCTFRMQIIADLQLHSKFSRAVSKDMILPEICAWTRRKGMGLVATGDWTHPLWMKEIKQQLEEMGNGLLKLKTASPTDPLFMLATEVSCIYSHKGKGRRVHTLIWVPNIASADKINKEMTRQGCNLLSDGRPIIGLSSVQVAELVFSIEPKALIIPAHAWTPWFSAYGSMSGFDSLDEAFGPYAKQIYAVETGLSSNPAMNWRIKELDNRSIVSFSDAHSGPKLGREATVFDIAQQSVSFDSIYEAVTQKGPSKIAYTIEFYPEEGKYHWSGHRACNIRWNPKETAKNGTTCPVCGKPLTEGVEQRVGKLAGRSEEDLKLIDVHIPVADKISVRMTKSTAFPDRPPYVSLVPLQEIIAECIGSPVASPKVQAPYRLLTDALGGEFAVLLSATHEDIARVAGERIAVGIEKVRSGDIFIDPGYDGVFGVVKLWKDGEEKPLVDASKEQLTLLS